VLAIAALRDGRVQGSNCISAGSFVDVRARRRTQLLRTRSV